MQAIYDLLSRSLVLPQRTNITLLQEEMDILSLHQQSNPSLVFLMSFVHSSYITSSYRFLFSRSEEHTSELQSRFDLVCRLLLDKKNRERAPASHVTARA